MRQLVVLLALAVISACSGPRIETGDLLFVGIPADYVPGKGTAEEAISQATSKEGELNIIHTAILERTPDDGIMVIDATFAYNVDRHPLDTLKKQFTLEGGKSPVFIVKRLKKGFRPEFIDNARKYIGQKYDYSFMPGNDEQYCTELVQVSYLEPDGTPIFPSAPMNFKNADGVIPEYWDWLFNLLGIPVPQDVPGTNPQDMFASPRLNEVMRF